MTLFFAFTGPKVTRDSVGGIDPRIASDKTPVTQAVHERFSQVYVEYEAKHKEAASEQGSHWAGRRGSHIGDHRKGNRE